MKIVSSRAMRVAVAVVLQLVLVGVAVSGQLSARITGEEYLLRVQPVDPIDPFRGAYVTLDYPDLQLDRLDRDVSGDQGTLFVPLVADGDFWAAGTPTRDRPGTAPYLTCSDRYWQLKCGIESYFLPQDKATALEEAIREGEVVARVKIDSRGNAALVSVTRSAQPSDSSGVS